MVLLAGPGYSTDIVANYLAARAPDLVVVVEHPQSRLEMTRRRARRVGWSPVVGQVLFVALLQPVLSHLGARRRAAVFRAASLDTAYRAPSHRVLSVNSDETVALLTTLNPAAVVVHGTRIIAKRVLQSVACPVINMHAGITLRCRGVHGGYWALAEQHPEWVGTTVHLVDPGIDTGRDPRTEHFRDFQQRYDRHLPRPALDAWPPPTRGPGGQGYGRQPHSSFHCPQVWLSRLGFLLSPDDLGLRLAALAQGGPMNGRRNEPDSNLAWGSAFITTIGHVASGGCRFAPDRPEAPPDEDVGEVRMADAAPGPW